MPNVWYSSINRSIMANGMTLDAARSNPTTAAITTMTATSGLFFFRPRRFGFPFVTVDFLLETELVKDSSASRVFSTPPSERESPLS